MRARQYNVDQVFDFLVEIGMRPIVELSFTPSAFVACGAPPQFNQTCDYVMSDHGGYKGLEMPPDDMEDWRKLVQATAEHLVGRYGLAEVSQWHFEVTPTILTGSCSWKTRTSESAECTPRFCSEHHNNRTRFECCAVRRLGVERDVGFPRHT